MRLPGSGPVSGGMGLTNTPLGTPEEVRQAHMDLRIVGTCAPKSPGIKGCDQYETCIFRYTLNGGFRDHGPHNIAYYHAPHEGAPTEQACSCHLFMSQLYHRMEAGARDRRAGLNGEIIEIIGQEGDTYHPTFISNENEAMPNLPPKWVRKTEPQVVPRWLRPHERQAVAQDALIEHRRMERERARTEWREGLPPEQRPRVTPMAEPEVLDMGDDSPPSGSEPPVAASSAVPVPRKVRP